LELKIDGTADDAESNVTFQKAATRGISIIANRESTP
jgi:hypothetical protein